MFHNGYQEIADVVRNMDVECWKGMNDNETKEYEYLRNCSF